MTVHQRRSFLFLQGVSTPFFPRLADALRAQGHAVHRINFNVGDMANWGRRGCAVSFRGRLSELPDFVRNLYVRYGITDQVLFGDRRPVHRPAVELAPEFGVRTHVFEEGYFRPFWVTLERGGVNRHSALPRDPDWYRSIGTRLPEAGQSSEFVNPFWKRAMYDVLYHGASALNPAIFPRYRTHAPYSAPVEYGGFLWRQAQQSRYSVSDKRSLHAVLRGSRPFFFLPLQLDSDSQIRDHSPFDGMRHVLHHVLQSFAINAAPESMLLIKNHPLDVGLNNYRKMVREIAEELGLQSRVVYVDTGALNPILRRAAGVVTVNSTTGMKALEYGCPVIALGETIYGLPGMTYQGSLDTFWQNAESPDPYLFHCFRNTVIYATQVNGGFYSGQGIDMVIRGCLPRMLASESYLEQLLKLASPGAANVAK